MTEEQDFRVGVLHTDTIDAGEGFAAVAGRRYLDLYHARFVAENSALRPEPDRSAVVSDFLGHRESSRAARDRTFGHEEEPAQFGQGQTARKIEVVLRKKFRDFEIKPFCRSAAERIFYLVKDRVISLRLRRERTVPNPFRQIRFRRPVDTGEPKFGFARAVVPVECGRIGNGIGYPERAHGERISLILDGDFGSRNIAAQCGTHILTQKFLNDYAARDRRG